jgi:hypothetical protein
MSVEGERISLRLEPEDLELLDKFVEQHPEYSNRSQLARLALRSFMESVEPAMGAGTRSSTRKNVLTVEIPRMAHETIMDSVRAGMFTSPESAVAACVSEKFIPIAEGLEAIKKRRLDALREPVIEMVPK